MKKLLLSLAVAFTLNSCENLSEEKVNLPAETQIGARTVGCLLNGKVYLPSDEDKYHPGVDIYCAYENGDCYFHIGFADKKNHGPLVYVATREVPLEVGKTYILNNDTNSPYSYIGGAGRYGLVPNDEPWFWPYTKAAKAGELKITRFNFSEGIISGTFWFDTENDKGEKIEIRQGRFDWSRPY